MSNFSIDTKNKIKTYWKWAALAALLMVTALGAYVYTWEYRKSFLEVDFLSLKRGRAIFIRTRENKTILVGGGQTSETIRELTTRMPFYRRTLDYVIVPSATPAQIGGLVEILDRYEVGEIIMPKLLATSTALDAVETKIRKKKIHVEEVERGDEVEIEHGLKIDVLFPYGDFKFNKSSLPELGFSLSSASTSVYFLGNLSKTVQKDIVKNLEVITNENIIEFYNSAIDSKVSQELLEKLNPKFIFSTKEKTAHAVSSGTAWKIN